MSADAGPGRPVLPATHRWPVTLEWGPLRLRPLRRRDDAEWNAVRLRNWEWLRRWEATQPATGDRVMSFRELVAAFRRQGRQGAGLPWVLEWTGQGGPRLIGQLTVMGIVTGSARAAQIGYWIDEAFAGRGITPFAVAWASDYCWQVMRLHRLEIAIRPENAPSLRVVEKLGFREEGLRPGYLHIDHDWRDHRVFALNAEEVPEGLLARCPLPRV